MNSKIIILSRICDHVYTLHNYIIYNFRKWKIIDSGRYQIIDLYGWEEGENFGTGENFGAYE